MKGKYLITVDNWFYAPDGKKYRSVWGDVEIFSDSILGIKTNYKSSNWYAKVGTNDNHVIIAGCQIHYAVRCETKPNDGPTNEFMYSSEGHQNLERPSEIYIAE